MTCLTNNRRPEFFTVDVVLIDCPHKNTFDLDAIEAKAQEIIEWGLLQPIKLHESGVDQFTVVDEADALNYYAAKRAYESVGLACEMVNAWVLRSPQFPTAT